MDVPFSSSGALSRRHYALIRSVESAASTQEGDRYLQAEIQALRSKLPQPDLTPARYQEYLVILLYCFNMVTHDFTPGSLDFVLPHAINLAETGETIEQKRIGYLFCAEFMRSDNELLLMLVNTVRKDLESFSVARICLALESLIALPSEYFVPAIQPRVHDLLSHNSLQVRRRAIHAHRILSRPENNLLLPACTTLLKRLNDPSHAVISAALSAVSSPIFRGSADKEQLSKVKAITCDLAFNNENKGRSSQLNALWVLSAFGPIDQDGITHLCDSTCNAAKRQDLAMLCATFRLLSHCPAEELKSILRVSPISYIRDLLASEDPNFRYVFLTCLSSLDPTFWAGSTEGFLGVLAPLEVEKIMRLIDSPDASIRIKTLSVLRAVDCDILDTVYTQLLQNFSVDANIRVRDEYMMRLLEVVTAKVAANGQMYAQNVTSLLDSVDVSSNGMPVYEVAIESVFSHIQYAGQIFQAQCVASLVAPIIERDSNLRPTMLAIVSALVTRYREFVSIPSTRILSGLAWRLPGAPPPVQDACILAMLFLAADCELSKDVQELITTVRDQAGHHIRKRCNQFEALVREKEILQDIIRKSRSPSLPDFLSSLESYEAAMARDPKPGPDAPTSNSRNYPQSKLRYDAYDAPRATPKLRAPKLPQIRPSPANDSEVHLNNTMRDVQLAQAPVDEPLSVIAGEATRGDDLIAFDQPLPSSPSSKSTFISIWESEDSVCDMRGWSDSKAAELVKKLQANQDMRLEILPDHEEPFRGEMKLIVTMKPDGMVALKFRKSEEDGTLWRLRVGRDEWGKRLRSALSNA